MISNYTDLSAAILKWCNKTDSDGEFIDQIPNFISLAEQQLFVDCPTVFNQNYLTSYFDIGTPYINKPVDWGRTLSLYIYNTDVNEDPLFKEHPDNFPIERVTFERGVIFAKKQTLRGIPKYYTDCALDTIQVFPWPDKSYPFIISYYAKTPPLSLENQQNINSLRNFDSLFFGTLSKAFAYLNNKENSVFYDGLYKERIAAVLAYDKNRVIDRDVNANLTNTFF
jgi:hypothetical protein